MPKRIDKTIVATNDFKVKAFLNKARGLKRIKIFVLKLKIPEV